MILSKLGGIEMIKKQEVTEFLHDPWKFGLLLLIILFIVLVFAMFLMPSPDVSVR